VEYIMAIWNDPAKAALNPEEAALLPALPRKNGAGVAALRTALRAAAAMDALTVSNAVEVGDAVSSLSQANGAPSRAARVPSRAALHHVLRR